MERKSSVRWSLDEESYVGRDRILWVMVGINEKFLKDFYFIGVDLLDIWGRVG